jgi:hypothetical protein
MPHITFRDRDRHFNRLFANWRHLPLPDLEVRPAIILRNIVRYHLTPGEWRTVDRMRDRIAALRAEGAQP